VSRLLELRLQGLGPLRDARLGCAAGFGALSGETGAGKSLCVAALRWVLGGRLEGDAVREGTQVAAVFEADPAGTALLGDLGIRVDDLLTLTREAGASGRTTCRVNGSLVSQTVLRDLGEQLADVTAQGASHRLLRRTWQRRALDEAGGESLDQARTATAEAHRAWRAATLTLAAAREASHRTRAELADAEQTIAELEALHLQGGEDEELAAERLRLRQAAAISRAATRIAEAASGDEVGGADLLSRALGEVESLGGVDPELAGLGGDAEALAGDLRELGIAARRLSERVELDATRLEAVEERLDVLARVRRRHGSVRQALAALEAAHQVVDAAGSGRDLAELEREAVQARARAGIAARRLSEARGEAARWLETAVEERLAVLELPHARFRVTLGVVADPEGVEHGTGMVRCDAEGIDQVEMRFASTRGGVPLPLDEGPSGGELSRLALALAAAGASQDQPLLVLDEVDTGVGGETAARVGDLLAEIGRGRQVIAVTHRPEIAARAAWHLMVERSDVGGGAVSAVVRVEGAARVDEVARMMSGRTTAAALRRAAELLEEGRAACRRRAG
jgi:DNA repair protein RecN (Recombination protein N)